MFQTSNSCKYQSELFHFSRFLFLFLLSWKLVEQLIIKSRIDSYKASSGKNNPVFLLFYRISSIQKTLKNPYL